MLLESSPSLRESKENISTSSGVGKQEVSLEELDLMTSHVCFQIYHLPTMSLGRFVEQAVPYVAPLIDALESSLPSSHQVIFTRRLFALLVARFGASTIEEALIDYFLDREHAIVPVLVTLGMKPHLVRYAEAALKVMTRQLCLESDRLDTILCAFRTPRVALFASSVSEMGYKEFLMHYLQADVLVPVSILEQLLSYSPVVPVQHCWEVLEKTLEIKLLNDTKTTREILTHLKPLIFCYSRLDPTCYLLEQCLLKTKSYLQAERKDLGKSVFEHLVGEPPSQMIEFDDPARDFDPFFEVMEEGEEWTPDPDYCLEPIRQSTKSLLPATVIANLYATPEALVTALQSALLYEYILKGRKPPKLALQYIPDSLALSVMLRDYLYYSKDRKVVISPEYWPKLPKKSNHAIVDNSIVLEHLFDVYTYEFTFDDKAKLQVQCNSSQAALIDSIVQSNRINLAHIGAQQEDAIFWLEQGVISLNDDSTFTLSSIRSPRPDARLLFVSSSEAATTSQNEGLLVGGFDFEPMKPFIKAMLTNLGAMSAAKIHATLAMFSSDYTNTDLNALITFLESLVSSGFLSFDSSLAAFK